MRLTTPKGRRPRPPLATPRTSALGIWVLRPMAGVVSETTHGGCIPELTYVGGPGPSLITSYGQDFHLESQMAMAHGNLTRGMACGGHIPAGNHEITRTDGATPVTSSYSV
jgi:hypothetical protein